jgi:hypothetical protein
VDVTTSFAFASQPLPFGVVGEVNKTMVVPIGEYQRAKGKGWEGLWPSVLRALPLVKYLQYPIRAKGEV